MVIVLGGTASNTGKTSVCLALAAGLTARGIKVRGFKAGPDYLDPMYLELVTGEACYNLDPWMSSQEHVLELVSRSPGLALVEGVMGYYDGAYASASHGSTAHLADILDSPVILVANAQAMARSFGALVSGFINFEQSGRRIKGIIANGCGSSRHADLLSMSLESAGLPPLLGVLPAGALPGLASRHLGLAVPRAQELKDDFIPLYTAAAEKYLDLDRIISLAGELNTAGPMAVSQQGSGAKARIGVARDNAFNFYYRANLDVLEQAGAELAFFSPIRDKQIPDGVQMLYLGGGYPELYAYELSQNKSMRRDILNFVRTGGYVYAECGGLIYLCRDLRVINGQVFPMTGAVPFRASMLPRRKSLGYTQVTFGRDCLLGARGESIKGHEFHYSEITPADKSNSWENIYEVVDSRARSKESPGISLRNILASYVHVYFGHRIETAKRIIQWTSG